MENKIDIAKDPLINFVGVTKIFSSLSTNNRTTIALDGVDAYLQKGEIVSLLGPSGCGKSTLLNILAGFTAPTSGKVVAHGEEVRSPGPDRLVVFQAPALFPWLNVIDNVLFGLLRTGKLSPEVYRERGREALRDTGLEGFETHWPYQLSGGMRQRVQIARALVSETECILLDEPFGALDAQTRTEMQELLLSLHEKYAPTVLCITHDIEEAIFISDRIYIMGSNPGRIVQEVNIPFARPRQLNCLVSDEFVRIRGSILSSIRRLKAESRMIGA